MNCRDVTLLIVGGDSDPNTQRIVDQAHLRAVDYFFWDTDLPQARQIAWDLASPEIDFGDVRLIPEAVFLRYNVFNDPSSHDAFAAHEVTESYALAWSNIRMLNRSTSGAVNNKSRNLVLGKRCGFDIPETTVLGNLSPLVHLPDADQKIIKPLSGGDHAMIARHASAEPERLNSLAPQFVQQRLTGENLRVFSVAGKLFAFHLKTDQVDYRTDQNVSVHAIDVPAELIDPTNRLVNQLGFDYCALDFRCRDSFEDPVFLEINSFPMFVAFDDACENQLADTLLEFLATPLR